MSLLGSAAMLLSFDVEPDAVDGHDRWHTHEHLPERVSIPGFVRGTRRVASEGTPRDMVVYEVESLATLARKGASDVRLTAYRSVYSPATTGIAA